MSHTILYNKKCLIKTLDKYKKYLIILIDKYKEFLIMKNQNKLARNALDGKFIKVKEQTFEVPPKGWIKAIRQALGLTSAQLAKKLNVKQPRVLEIERDETSLSLKNLEKVADALGCKLVYALVPKTSLEEMAYNQAEKKAKKILQKVSHNMALENQTPIYDKMELEDMTQELLNGSQARLWDEDG